MREQGRTQRRWGGGANDVRGEEGESEKVRGEGKWVGEVL